MNNNRERGKVAAVDFDGVICEDSDNIFRDFEQARYPAAQPGVAEGLAWLQKNGFEIVIYTCRPYEHRRYLESFLRRHECEYDYMVFHGKPRADVYIDDKAVRFTSWGDTVRELEQRFADAGNAFAAEPNTLFEEWLKRERWRHIAPHPQAALLDVGCGRAPYWPEWVDRVVAVEPDRAAHARIAGRARLAAVVPDLAELRRPVESFDLVVALGVLEHVADPDAFLDALAGCRRMFLTVPNATSFHRQVGWRAGKIKAVTELAAADVAIGHQRYYTSEAFHSLLEDFAAQWGFRVGRFGSCGFKPLPNAALGRHVEVASSLALVAEELQLVGDNKFWGAELYAELTR